MFLTHALRAIYRVTSDALWKYVTLLLTGAPQVSTFITDASTNNFQLASFGDTRPNNFNPYTPGYYSNIFNGTTDYLSAAQNSAFDITGDFTIECWVYFTALPSPNQDGNRIAALSGYSNGTTANQGFEFGVNFTGNAFAMSSWGAGNRSDCSFTPVLNTWYHLAATKQGSTSRLFINGVSQTLTVNTLVINAAPSGSLLNVGRSSSSSGGALNYFHYLPGYISNFRIVKGTAVYTANFTPPTAPLTAIANTSVLTCANNRFIDSSSNNFTLTRNGSPTVSPFDPFVLSPTFRTYGSTYFDGTGDYLTVPNNAAFNFGANSFTIECWFMLTANATADQDGGRGATLMCAFPNSGAFSADWTFAIGGDNTTTGTGIAFSARQSGAQQAASYTSTITKNIWHHFAVTKVGNTVSLYYDGVRVAQNVSFTNNVNSGGFPIKIGALLYSTAGTGYMSYFPGYISDLRVVNGSAVYTGTTYTVPTAPLTAIANTSLLTLQTNQPINNSTFLDNSSLGNFITRSGNATQGSYSPYGGNWSTLFNGSSNLSYPVTSAFTGQTFTIEGWVNFTRYSPLYGSNSYACILVGSDNGTNGFEVWIGGTATSFVAIGFLARGGGTVTVNVSQSYTFALHTWYHVAVVKSGNSYTFYVNGTSIGTSTSAGTWTDVSPLYVGYIAVSGFNQWMYGYISNVRVVTGTAVYTSNFTPSTTPLTAIANTRLLTCADNRFVDDSVNNFASTVTGSPSVQRFSPFSPVSSLPVSYGAYFDGTGDYLTTTFTSAGSSDFCLECWVFVSNVSANRYLFSQTNTTVSSNADIGFAVLVTSASKAALYWNFNTTQPSVTSTNNVNLNQWNHIAAVRSGSTFTIYLNGTGTSTTSSGTINVLNSTPRNYIGYFTPEGNSTAMIGYMSNLRLVIGSPVYTSNFTPSTSPLTAISNTQLLTCQSPSLIDNSTNNFTITRNGDVRPVTQNPFGFTNALTTGYDVTTVSGSAYFDGTGDFLTVPTNAAFNLGSSNFTIECWLNPQSFSAAYALISRYDYISSTASGYILRIINATTIRFVYGTDIVNDVTVSLNTNSWYHVALTRSGTAAKLFLNGAQVGSFTINNFSDANSAFQIGRTHTLTDSANAYISDLRIIKGTALYTGPFVPPVAPLPAVTNTTLLLNATSAGVYDASMLSDLETVGGTRVTTATSKYSGSSLYFNGSSNLKGQVGINSLGTGNFTIEMWIYPESAVGYQCVLQIVNTPPYIFLGINTGSTGTPFMWNDANVIVGSQNFVINAWQHWAIVRNNGTVTMYLNGNSIGSAVYSGNLVDNGTFIGTNNGGAQGFTGHIDDLRITKGVARYTANFTPPTAALPTF
jgi:hypothetical protein